MIYLAPVRVNGLVDLGRVQIIWWHPKQLHSTSVRTGGQTLQVIAWLLNLTNVVDPQTL